jgi:hypothetical protein
MPFSGSRRFFQETTFLLLPKEDYIRPLLISLYLKLAASSRTNRSPGNLAALSPKTLNIYPFTRHLKEPKEQVKAKGEIEKKQKPEIGEHVKLGIAQEAKQQSEEVQ